MNLDLTNLAKFLIYNGRPNSKWDSNLKSRFNGGKHDLKGNNFQKVCIRKFSSDGYGWQKIDEIKKKICLMNIFLEYHILGI